MDAKQVQQQKFLRRNITGQNYILCNYDINWLLIPWALIIFSSTVIITVLTFAISLVLALAFTIQCKIEP
jgi:hypothetical protein